MADPVFYIPALFNVLCFVLASMFLLVPVFWLWRVKSTPVGVQPDSLGFVALTASVRIVFLACLFSPFYGVLYDERIGGVFSFMPEFILLFLMVAVFVWRGWRRRQALFFMVLCEVWLQLFLVLSLLVFWFVVVVLIYGVFALLLLCGVSAVVELSVLLLAGGGLLGLLLFHRHVGALRKDDLPKGFAFHNILWPIVLGLFLLILPLLLQDISYNPKLKEKRSVIPRSFKA